MRKERLCWAASLVVIVMVFPLLFAVAGWVIHTLCFRIADSIVPFHTVAPLIGTFYLIVVVGSTLVVSYLAAEVVWDAIRWKYVNDRCCEECGYDLTGNVSGRCPECGTPTVREADRTDP